MREHSAPEPGRAQARPFRERKAGNERGDLLTASSTPGHTMKVSEDAKARFTVLGQALTSLSEGRGWVQVLVRCQ